MSEALRVVRVQVIPAEGYVLEIEGSTETPLVTADDAEKHLAGSVDYEVRAVLGIAKDVPLTLFVVLPDELA
ncbi:hypothetical protein ACIPYS_17740 [Kitasatospora sp. NPDC089913]|uniref:hypothetical protein n=1 Tax=Kitasatospora sp. NPDC089913 TaxID=3364080 RepID=UPI00381684F5